MATLQEQWAQKQDHLGRERPARERPRVPKSDLADDGVERAPARDAVDPTVIGARVRALREASDLSLRDLAARSGVSAPMLSQVERGETSPTLVLAAKIAAGLELRLSQLLRLDEDGAVTIVRAGERSHGGSEQRGHRYEVMTAAQPGQRAELSRHTLAAGGATGAPDDPPMHEPGSRETALVEHGAVVLICDGERHELAEGDCVTFDADLPHHFENAGEGEASFLAVVSAGLRRS
jgi:XRE family transcriptional regulator, regulator of sulfur utilization